MTSLVSFKLHVSLQSPIIAMVNVQTTGLLLKYGLHKNPTYIDLKTNQEVMKTAKADPENVSIPAT